MTHDRGGPAVPRRTFIHAAFAALAVAPLHGARADASYPGAPVRIVVPSPPGGGLDVMTRRVGLKLADFWNVPVTIENRPGGAGGSIAAVQVARARPDGLTLMVHASPLVQIPWVQKLPFNALTDFVPAGQMSGSPTLLCVGKSFPASNFEEFIAAVQAQPGKYSYGSWGHGSTTHLQGALLCKQAGLDMTHVPFPGAAPVVTAMLGGHVTAAFVDPGTASRTPDALKVLAISGRERSRQFPDTPTLGEKRMEHFDLNNWTGFFVPAGTPASIVERISADLVRALGSPDVRGDLERMNITVSPAPADRFKATVDRDYAAWGDIVKLAGIGPMQ